MKNKTRLIDILEKINRHQGQIPEILTDGRDFRVVDKKMGVQDCFLLTNLSFTQIQQCFPTLKNPCLILTKAQASKIIILQHKRHFIFMYRTINFLFRNIIHCLGAKRAKITLNKI